MDRKEVIKFQEKAISGDLVDNTNDKPGHELNHRINPEAKCYAIRSVNVTPDNRYLIITNDDNERIRIIDLHMLEYMPHKYNTHVNSVRLTSITRDGSAFYTASWDGSSHRYEIESGNCKQIIVKSGYPMPSCYISDDEKYLFTANYESINGLNSVNRGRCLDLETQRLFEYQHKNRRQNPGSMDIVYDGKFVYSGSDDGIAHRWSLKYQRSLMKYFELPVSVRKIAVSERYFAAACTDGTIRVYFKKSGKKYKHFKHNNPHECMDVRITKDETKLISAASDGVIICFDLLSGKTIFHRRIHRRWIWSICLFNDDNLIASGSTDGTVAFTNLKGQVVARFYNLVSNDLLISCPPQKNDPFPNGCYHTTNKSLILVYTHDTVNRKKEVLDEEDEQRLNYIDKHNRKNIIISRIQNQDEYEKLVTNYSRDKNLLDKANNLKSLKLLKEQNLG